MGLARLLILFSALVAGCASQQPAEAPWPEAEPLAGSFISCPQEERLKKEKLPRKLKGSGYILFGEGHTNKCDHQVQAKLVRIMAESGKRFCIGLEMVTANMQPVLDRFNSGDLDLADLQGRLDWANNWGYDYGFYSRIFELAREHDLPVFGLNLPSEVVRTVSRQGLTGLDKEQKKHLPQKIIPPPEGQKEALEPFFSGHSKMLEETGLSRERFFLAQAVRESKMAEEAVARQRQTGLPMLILTGAGHVETGWGLGYRLEYLDPEAGIIRVLPKREPECIDADQGLFYYCPSTPPSRLGMVMEEKDGTVVVQEVVSGSLAEKKGIGRGDILSKADGREVTRLMDLHEAALESRQRGRELCLEIKSSGSARTVCFDLGRNKE